MFCSLMAPMPSNTPPAGWMDSHLGFPTPLPWWSAGMVSSNSKSRMSGNKPFLRDRGRDLFAPNISILTQYLRYCVYNLSDECMVSSLICSPGDGNNILNQWIINVCKPFRSHRAILRLCDGSHPNGLPKWGWCFRFYHHYSSEFSWCFKKKQRKPPNPGGFNPFEKYAGQNGLFSQVGKMESIRNHYLDDGS